MSGLLMGNVYLFEMSKGQRAILLALADHAEDLQSEGDPMTGVSVYPSVDRISWKTDYDRRSVQRLLRELEELGVLQVVREATRYYPTEYRICLGVLSRKKPFESGRGKAVGQNAAPGVKRAQDDSRGDIEDVQGRGSERSGAAPTPPEPSVEPSDKPLTTSEPADAEDHEETARDLAAAEDAGKGQTTLSVGHGDDIDSLVAALWDYYVELFEPSRSSLTPSRARAIKKGFKEEFTLDDLKLAVLGLKLWRKTKSGDESISTLFTTYPGGQTLADRIAFFIDVAEKAGPAGHITSADPAIVQQRQLDVQRGHRSATPESVQKAQEAEDWLRQHGIETARGEDGYPTFHVAGSAS
jgi:hypothetical protein